MAKATSKTIKLSDPDQTLLEACARAAELEAAIDLAYVVDPKDEVAIGELEQFQGLDCGRGADAKFAGWHRLDPRSNRRHSIRC